ncbi:unnamed protein product [Zymoseptoria tritici ST99CH_1A5]|uniref:Uncharacterized protein n=1 Tax=Zymoseptoria tritici ST99CH_1A5 TaxID=1276529 RepID=A0A1Y6LUY1_ZYMTR|nr:unnamed protein product [Zymoseptoria tritici ST99CH_1A5]
MILGGFLMLPATFERDNELRVPTQVIGIFAAALLTAGFSATLLVCIVVPNPLFQVESIFQPALAACFVGVLTVTYDFLFFKRYHWNTPAFLTTVAAGVSSVVYGILQIWTRRKINSIVKAKNHSMAVPLNMPGQSTPGMSTGDAESFRWQDTAYYDNYARNMFPSAMPPDSSTRSVFDPHTVPEEELQRQQMLNLLLAREQAQLSPPLPAQDNATYHIDIPVPNENDSPATLASPRHYPSPGGPSPMSVHARPSPGVVRPWNEDVLREVDRRR